MDASKGSSSGESSRPSRIGPYTVLRELGEGGMGSVYLASDPVLPRNVAVKVVKPGMGSRDILARFEQERTTLAVMDHRGIARVLDAGTTDEGQPYFVMEYVPGRPLVEYCDARRLGVSERLRLFCRVCDAVQHAHQKGVIHRDLKPGNILVKEEEDMPVPKIIDFGLARALYPGGRGISVVTEQGRILGTPEYMSPEQAGGPPQDVDTRADVYALGVILYELLVGELPFPHDMLATAGMLEMHRIIREVEPPTPSSRLRQGGAGRRAAAAARGTTTDRLFRAIARDLDWITHKAMEKDRHRRYASAHALAEDVQRFLADEPVLAGPPSNGYRLRKWVRRHRAALVVGSSLLIGVAGVGLFALAEIRSAEGDLQKTLDLDPTELASLLEEHDGGGWRAVSLNAGYRDEWLRRARGLVDRLPMHHRRLRQWRELDVPPAGVSFEYWDRFLADAGALAADEGPLAHFESLGDLPRTLVDPDRDADADWTAAIDAIARSGRYDGLRLPRLPQLQPLGENPQGYWEFFVPGTGERPRLGADGTVDVAGDTAIVLVLLPGGPSRLGTDPGPAPGEPAFMRPDRVEGPAVDVRLRPFLIGKFEVTQRQWRRMAGFNPSNYRTSTDWAVLPVERVTWREAMDFVPHWGLALPTEAQWQYACLAGAAGPWQVDDWHQLARVANLADAAARRAGAGPAWAELVDDLDDGFALTAPVGSLEPNAFGVHDLHGNVYEFCADAYRSGDYAFRVLDDGTGGQVRVDDPGSWPNGISRGGSFRSGPWRLRAYHRNVMEARQRSPTTGVRVACWPW